VGDTVTNPDVGEFGITSYSVNEYASRMYDFALIDIYPSHYQHANPQLRHWGGPQGVSHWEDTTDGLELIDNYGYGALVGSTEQTRHRQGDLIRDTAEEYYVDSPIWWGDSGGPMVTHDGRLALGVVSRAGWGDGVEVKGSTVEWILENLEADGIEITLIYADIIPQLP